MKAKLLIMLAGIAMLAACKSSTTATNTDSVATADSVKLVKTADMRIKVKDVQKVAEQITNFTRYFGGTVMHHTMQSNVVDKQDLQLSNDSIKRLTVYNDVADLVIKLPSNIVDPFMDSLSHFSNNVDERKMDVEDRTLDYAATKLKAQNRQASVKLRSRIKLTQGGADTLLALKDDAVNKQISNMRTDNDSKYSTITLSLYQNNAIRTEVIPNDDLSNYNTPLKTRIGLSLSKGWSIFTDLVAGILNLWVFILAAAIVTFMVIRFKKKQQKKVPVQ